MMEKKSKSKNHYVDNAKFLEEMVAYRKMVSDAKDKGLARPKVPEYIGHCFLEIATNLSHKPNFANYQYREDMIMDGVENCLQYIDNFDPSKSNNPFSYFTQITYYAFVRRIQKEKKTLYVKYKAIQDSLLHDDEVTITQYGSDHAHSQMEEFIKQYEESKQSKKKKKEKKTVLEQMLTKDGR